MYSPKEYTDRMIFFVHKTSIKPVFLFEFHFFLISYDFLNISFFFLFFTLFRKKKKRKFSYLHLSFITKKDFFALFFSGNSLFETTKPFKLLWINLDSSP